VGIRGIAHVSFKVADLPASKAYYTDGLGFEHLYDLTYGDVIARIAVDRAAGTLPGDIDDAAIAYLTDHAAEVWSSYLKIAPGQFLELFAARPGNSPLGDLEERIGYQHFALEVDDIAAYEQEINSRGVAADSALHVGPDNTKQMWLVDPDGNRLELHEYTAESLQLRGTGRAPAEVGSQS